MLMDGVRSVPSSIPAEVSCTRPTPISPVSSPNPIIPAPSSINLFGSASHRHIRQSSVQYPRVPCPSKRKNSPHAPKPSRPQATAVLGAATAAPTTSSTATRHTADHLLAEQIADSEGPSSLAVPTMQCCMTSRSSLLAAAKKRSETDLYPL